MEAMKVKEEQRIRWRLTAPRSAQQHAQGPTLDPSTRRMWRLHFARQGLLWGLPTQSTSNPVLATAEQSPTERLQSSTGHVPASGANVAVTAGNATVKMTTGVVGAGNAPPCTNTNQGSQESGMKSKVSKKRNRVSWQVRDPEQEEQERQMEARWAKQYEDSLKPKHNKKISREHERLQARIAAAEEEELQEADATLSWALTRGGLQRPPHINM